MKKPQPQRWKECAPSEFHDDSRGMPEKILIYPYGREAVYDGDDGSLITEGGLEGSYNYQNRGYWSCGPSTWGQALHDDIKHFILDVLPYFIWGN